MTAPRNPVSQIAPSGVTKRYGDLLVDYEARDGYGADSRVDSGLHAFGHGAFKLCGRDHGARGRIRIAKERVQRLTREPVLRLRYPCVWTPNSTRSGRRDPRRPRCPGYRSRGVCGFRT